jgi:acyl-CoA synthetase (NDP forming)
MKTPVEIIQTAASEGRKALFEHEAKALARANGIIVPKSELVNPEHEKEIVVAGEKLGFPLALKAESTEILHKTEAGAVVLDIKNTAELASAAKQIKNNVSQRAPGAVIRHFLIEKMMPPGLELLIGGLRDDQFGPCVAFGLGGVWVEALKDAVFGILPMTHEEASGMIAQTRAGMLLKGFRSGPALDEEALHLIINNLSTLMTDHPEIGSIDLNPVRCYARGAAALDVRVVLGESRSS